MRAPVKADKDPFTTSAGNRSLNRSKPSVIVQPTSANCIKFSEVCDF